MPPRDKLQLELINARVPAGTGKRMDKVLKGGELRSGFIRSAIENELQRREAEVVQPRDMPKLAR